MKTPLVILFYLCISLKINGQIKSDFSIRTMITVAQEINNCDKKGMYDYSHTNVAMMNLHDYYRIDSFCISIHEDYSPWSYYRGARYYYILEDVIFIATPTQRETQFAALIGFEPMNLEMKLKLEKHWVNYCDGFRELFISGCSY